MWRTFRCYGEGEMTSSLKWFVICRVFLFLTLSFLPLSLFSVPFPFSLSPFSPTATLSPLSSSPSNQLTALITSFYLKLSEHFTHPQFLEQIREIGFLAQFESLLSTFGQCGTLSVVLSLVGACVNCRFTGDESGMLEDTCVAVAELGTVTFQVCFHWC